MNSNTDKHSPLPLSYCNEKTGGCICGQIWSVPQDFNIATCEYKQEELGEIPIEQMKANAAYIVEAANNYPLLKEQNKLLLDALKNSHQTILNCYNKIVYGRGESELQDLRTEMMNILNLITQIEQVK